MFILTIPLQKHLIIFYYVLNNCPEWIPKNMTKILIIAGSSDIGFSTAKQLKTENHDVFITGRKEESIRALASELGCPYAILDARDFSATVAIFDQAKSELGGLDGAVNCSGSILLKPAHLTTEEQFHDTINTNLTTAFSVVHAAGKTFVKDGGSVVLLSSAAAQVGLSNHEAIAAAKAGIIGLAKSAASTYANNNIRFNVVAPGLVDTKLTSALTNSDVGRKVSESMHPLGRLGTAEDIAAAITFFLDPNNNWITGQVLSVDGGLANVRSKMKA
jgi:3-oxoacyl-[acyl-carrier protein] reductase